MPPEKSHLSTHAGPYFQESQFSMGVLNMTVGMLETYLLESNDLGIQIQIPSFDKQNYRIPCFCGVHKSFPGWRVKS